MSYFILNNFISKTQKFVSLRKQREPIKGLKNSYQFSAGDIINLVYFKKSLGFTFEGICLSVKKISLCVPNSSFLLRNIILGVGVEFLSSFFYNRNYFLTLLDYKRKSFFYRNNKLYYLRNKVNRNSKI